jgi:hypothetical protein
MGAATYPKREIIDFPNEKAISVRVLFDSEPLWRLIKIKLDTYVC